MLNILPADIKERGVATLLDKHFDLMRSQSPEESCHVLPRDSLTGSDIFLFALRESGEVQAIGAIRRCGSWGEIKSMHTAERARGRGIGRALLEALILEAKRLELQSLKLETGSGKEHRAARHLYESVDFVPCPPFGDYTSDPLSAFMTLVL